LWLPLALRYQDLSPEGLQLDLEFIDHVFKLVFINEYPMSLQAREIAWPVPCGLRDSGRFEPPDG
jgi:hypothetical protein